MEGFFTIITSFPTAIFSLLLTICILYWLVSLLGFVGIDSLDLDIDVDPDGGAESAQGIAGLMTTLGLTGVPLTLVITLLTLDAWGISFFGTYLIRAFIADSGLLYMGTACVLLMAALLGALFMTQLTIRPLRPLFKKTYASPNKHLMLVGKVCKVRSTQVNKEFGEAVFEEEGTSLIIKVRYDGPLTMSKGDTAYIIEYNDDNNSYLVVTEAEFSAPQ